MPLSERPGVLLVARSFILNAEGEILLVKRSSTDRHYPSLWECPGGKLDQGEDLDASRAREALEETGLVVETLHPSFTTDSHIIDDESEYDGLTYVVIFSIARVVGGELLLSEEHNEAAWVHYGDAFSYDLTPEVRKALHAFFLLQMHT